MRSAAPSDVSLSLASSILPFLPSDGAVERTFTIIATEASVGAAQLHNRMSLILQPSDWPVWLGEAEFDPAALLYRLLPGVLRVWPVS